jgi:chromosome partitioning protein
MGSGVDKHGLARTTYDLLMGDAPAAEIRTRVPGTQYDLLPSNGDLTGAEVGLLEEIGRELRLRKGLEPIRAEYDFILIDCPPALSRLTVNALVAADTVMIPMQCEYYALEGLTALLQTVEKIRRYLNPELRVEGLLRTMYDPRNNLASQVSAQLLEHFGDKVYRTIIPRNVRLAEAPSHGLPVLLYDRSSKGALAYLALAGEILRRDGAPMVSPG